MHSDRFPFPICIKLSLSDTRAILVNWTENIARAIKLEVSEMSHIVAFKANLPFVIAFNQDELSNKQKMSEKR